jgi:hypothetical protein
LSVLCGLILLAAFSRLIPHPSNFAPIGAMSLFGAAYFSRKYVALLVPALSMWLSDLFINNVVYGSYFNHFVWLYEGCFWTYLGFALITLVGFWSLKTIRVKTLLLSSLIASILFFLVSNFGVWFSTNRYTADFSGLLSCYIAGLPFFKNTLLGDVFYVGLLFGSFEWAQRMVPQLRMQRARR